MISFSHWSSFASVSLVVLLEGHLRHHVRYWRSEILVIQGLLDLVPFPRHLWMLDGFWYKVTEVALPTSPEGRHGIRNRSRPCSEGVRQYAILGIELEGLQCTTLLVEPCLLQVLVHRLELVAPIFRVCLDATRRRRLRPTLVPHRIRGRQPIFIPNAVAS